MNDFFYSPELLEDIKKMPKKYQRSILKTVRDAEWEKCEASVEYWLDNSLHPAEVYAYTFDPHSLYTCRRCVELDPKLIDISIPEDKLIFHLEHKHKVVEKNFKAAVGLFTRLPAFRPWTMKEYMPPIIKYWKESKLFAIEKSRDMMATWLMIMLHIHDVLFHQGRQYVFQSKDSSTTLTLTKDCAFFVYDSMPDWMKNKNKAIFTQGANKSGLIVVPNLRSEIIGQPQGPDQIRRLHPSGVFMDEAAFLKLAGDTFAAIKPAIQVGGRFTAISSAYPSWFQMFVQDHTDD